MAEAITDIASFVTESTVPDAVYDAAGPQPPTTAREQWIQSVTLHQTTDEIVVNLVGAVYDHRIFAKAESRELERRLHARLDQWGEGITSRVDGIEERLGALNQRFDRMERRSDEKIGALNQRFDRMERRSDEKIGALNERFDRMERRSDEKIGALNERFDRMESRTDLMDQMLASRLSQLEKGHEEVKALLKGFILEVRVSSFLPLDSRSAPSSSIGGSAPNTPLDLRTWSPLCLARRSDLLPVAFAYDWIGG